MKKPDIKKFFSKKLNIVITSVLCAVLMAGVVLMCVFLPTYKGTPSAEMWTPADAFTADSAVVLYKQPGEDFVILNFADTQFKDVSALNKGSLLYKTMQKCISDVQPDMITMSGDNFTGPLTKQCQKKLIEFMESFEIPWAPVFGNHDHEGNADIEYLGEQFEAAEHCLFQKGPANVEGVGNYVINIMEGDKIVHTLIMMDSHDYFDYSEMDDQYKMYTVDEDGKTVQLGGGYDFIRQTQIDWYQWVVDGVKALSGGTVVESSLIFHIPLPEYDTAYQIAMASDPATVTGEKRESVACAQFNSHFFDTIRDMGSTKNILVGHDHVNDYTVEYQGVRLNYAVKTGDWSYWVDGGSVNGGTVLRLDSAYNLTLDQHYVTVD